MGTVPKQKELQQCTKSFLEEKMKGNVSKLTFKRLTFTYDEKIISINSGILKLKKQLSKYKKSKREISEWILRIKKNLILDELTRTIVVELIECIEVTDVYEVNNEKQMDIKIKFKFQSKPVTESRAI